MSKMLMRVRQQSMRRAEACVRARRVSRALVRSPGLKKSQEYGHGARLVMGHEKAAGN